MATKVETAITGEVIITSESTADAKAQALKENETIIKRNWAKATEKVETVYRSLTYIHTFDLWKLHKDEAGKRKYSSFEKYLFGEFGWELSRVRALQIIKATRAKMIEAGELPASAAEPRTRTAPEVTSERAAKITAAQLTRVLEAFKDRVDNIDEGDTERAQIVHIYDEVAFTLNSAIANLLDVVAAAEAIAETAEPSANGSEPAAEGESDEDDDSAA
jgi:hypothetical protein